MGIESRPINTPFPLEKIRDLEQFVNVIEGISSESSESLDTIESSVNALAVRLDERIAFLNANAPPAGSGELIAKSITAVSAATAFAVDYILDLTPGIDLKYKIIAMLLASPLVLNANIGAVSSTLDRARDAKSLYIAMRQRTGEILRAIEKARNKRLT